jgi:periodic tryptophan protein 1
MQAVPIHSTDTIDTVREKLKRQNPELAEDHDRYLEVEESRALETHGKHANVNGALESDEDDDVFTRFAGGDTVLDQVESDDDDEINDTQFKDTDLVFLAGCAAEEPKLELYVYDEPDDNVYVHHDVTVSSYPLSIAWMTDGTMSLAAVGTMLPFIEIWPLDVVDAVEPACMLGGCTAVEDNYKRKIKRDKLKPDSHRDAVLTLQWNTLAQHILVSGSADCTIKLWDLNDQRCVGTYTEPAKVQSMQWHSQEANLLLSGDFDGNVVLRDCRRPEDAAIRWHVGDATEHVEFAHHFNAVLCSTTSGEICAYDMRMDGELLWRVQAHDAETTFSVSRHVPGLLATGGKDGLLTLWDMRRLSNSGGPQVVVSRKYKTGSVLAIAFHPNSPHIVGACGSRGQPLVYTMTQDIAPIFG